MLDNKGYFVLGEFLIALVGVLIWFSSDLAHELGITGFFSRLFAGLVCFIIALALHAIATR